VGGRFALANDTFIVASTHQETQDFRPVGEYQAAELINEFGSQRYLTILLGDFNSAANADAPETSKTGAYGLFLAAGFKDLWTATNAGAGLTCCHAEDLKSDTRTFDQRLDIIFLRDANILDVLHSSVTIVGATERSAGGLFASDHAGVVGKIFRY
jgi:endonuclease/exonuclease/phosphatase family metal-dependent hydrolase